MALNKEPDPLTVNALGSLMKKSITLTIIALTLLVSISRITNGNQEAVAPAQAIEATTEQIEPTVETSPEPIPDAQAIETQEVVEQPEIAQETPPAQPEKVRWQDNPSNCDLTRQTVWPEEYPEFPCHDKASEPDANPAPVPPEPIVRSGTGSCDLAYNYDWPSDIAAQICQYESSGNPNAANPTDNHYSWAGCYGSYGLMQINCSHGQVYDGKKNMDIAYSMYKGWGNSFKAWTTCAKVPGCR